MTAPPRLIVAVDFSQPSIAAALRAVDLAPALGAKITLLYAVDATMLYTGYIEAYVEVGMLVEQAQTWARARLDRLAAEIDPDRRFVDVVDVIVGRPVHAITERARADAVRWIVAGTHGRSSVARLFLGSVAERLVRQAPCDVLVVHERPLPTASGRRKVVVGHDFSEDARRALDEAVRLARTLELDIDLVHVVESAAFEWADAIGGDTMRAMARTGAAAAQGLIEKTAREADPDGRVIKTARIVSGSAAQALIDAAATDHAALIAVGTHGRGGFQRMFVGSVAERVARLAPCDVLVCRAPHYAERG